jgi:hypothetical protein
MDELPDHGRQVYDGQRYVIRTLDGSIGADNGANLVPLESEVMIDGTTLWFLSLALTIQLIQLGGNIQGMVSQGSQVGKNGIFLLLKGIHVFSYVWI